MFCQRTKEYLSQKGIVFSERDVTKDPAALEKLKKLKAMTSPMTVIDGQVIVGFDTERIDAALAHEVT